MAPGEGTEPTQQDQAIREREGRLARVVEQLKRRLEQLREENEQLEDMLRQADRKSSGVLSCASMVSACVLKDPCAFQELPSPQPNKRSYNA